MTNRNHFFKSLLVATVMFLVSAPLTRAQSDPITPAGPAGGEGTNLQAPVPQAQKGVRTDRNLKPLTDTDAPATQTQTKPEVAADGIARVSVVVKTTSSDNNRYLGDVKIKFSKTKNTKEKNPNLTDPKAITIPDPPSPSGYIIADIPAVEWEIIAERRGYEIYDKITNVPDNKSYFELDVKLKAQPGTPKVSQSDLDYFNNQNGTLGNNFQTNNNAFSAFNTNGFQGSSGNQFATNNGPFGQNQFPNQQTQFSSQTQFQTGLNSQYVAVNSNSNYKIAQSSANGNYFLVNQNNQSDNRALTFVDRGDGLGGMVFMPTENSTEWFINTYGRDSSGNIGFTTDRFSRTLITPSSYTQLMNGRITQNFQTTLS